MLIKMMQPAFLNNLIITIQEGCQHEGIVLR